MASMKLEEQLEEQPTEKKPRIHNCREEGGNASNPNESDLPESAKEESTYFHSSRRHCELSTELNHEIFYCLNLATRRKFIYGLGWDFYSLFRQILLIKFNLLWRYIAGHSTGSTPKCYQHQQEAMCSELFNSLKSKRICNPKENAWIRSSGDFTRLENGLVANNYTNSRQNVYAEKGFPIDVADCRMDGFPGTICYYYEVKTVSKWCVVGFWQGGTIFGVCVNFGEYTYYICYCN